MLIPDPIGDDRGYTLIIACCTIPADLSDKENICSKIIKAREQEEQDIGSVDPLPTRYLHTS
jgi:hypothetical protein